MMGAQPNQACVRDVAFMLSAMTPENAGDGIKKIMAAIRSGMVERGWRQAEADDFAVAFGMAVVDQIRALPHMATVH